MSNVMGAERRKCVSPRHPRAFDPRAFAFPVVQDFVSSRGTDRSPTPPPPHRQVALPREGGAAGPPEPVNVNNRRQVRRLPASARVVPSPSAHPPGGRASLPRDRRHGRLPHHAGDDGAAARDAERDEGEQGGRGRGRLRVRSASQVRCDAAGRSPARAGAPVASPLVRPAVARAPGRERQPRRARRQMLAARRTIPASPFTRTSPRTSPRRSVCSSWWRRSARRSVAWSASG